MNQLPFPHAFAPDAKFLSATALDMRRPWIERGHNALWLVAALWLECTIVWLVWHWGSFAHLEFRDPDDALRLMQVRNFVAGQDWFDVSQPRVNPPFGGPMHWSRLVDLPIAGLIVALRPLLGDRLAEIVACVAVPPLTLLAMCLALYASVKRLFGPHRTVLTVALLVTSFPILTQMAPLRIDHHAWQIVASVGVLGGMLTLDPRRGGWIAGASMALWLHISGEALPYIALYGAVFALRYVARPAEEWPRFIRFMGALALASAALLLGVKGWTVAQEIHCDSMSPPYLLPLVAMVPVLIAGHRLLGTATLLRRIIPLGAAAATGALTLVSYAPQCLHGPFQALDPLVYNVWYLAIMEGQPIWKQDLSTGAIILIPGLLGLGGMIGAVLTEKDADKRFAWLSILGMALGAFGVSIMVLRAVGVAHLLMLIGNMWIIARLYPRIAALPTMAARVSLTVSLSLLTPFGGAAIASAIVAHFTDTPEDISHDRASTHLYQQVEALNALPPSLILVPLDLGPEILLRTHHRIVATGHHRNIVGMTEVIRVFAQPPEQARKIVAAYKVRYIFIPPNFNEVGHYRKIAPQGLANWLVSDKPLPTWLERVHLKGEGASRTYRIVPPPAQPGV